MASIEQFPGSSKSGVTLETTQNTGEKPGFNLRDPQISRGAVDNAQQKGLEAYYKLMGYGAIGLSVIAFIAGIANGGR